MMGNLSGGERHCPDDLVVRGRREHLTELERHALAAHLAQCAECRAAAALTTLFDAVPDSQPGDAELIARIADKASRAPRRLPHWRGLRIAAVVALAVLTSGAATAAWMVYRQSSVDRAVREPLPPTPGRRTPLLRARRSGLPASPPQAVAGATEETAPVAPVTSPPEAPAATADETPSMPELQRKRRSPVPVTPASAPTAPTAPTAASLFTEANAVRRGGEIRKAIGLYQDLRQRFPESSQALLSAVSVGDLLLGQGDAAGAVAAYAAYLRGSPKGSLTEEALFGRARGLRMLGRSVEERRTWQELLRRFPRSAYQPAAARRLRELAP